MNLSCLQIEVRLVFKQGKLRFEPPLEELRTKHYKEHLNPFLRLPLIFTGVSDMSENPGFFKHILQENVEGIVKVYSSVESLFGSLAEEAKKFQVLTLLLHSTLQPIKKK